MELEEKLKAEYEEINLADYLKVISKRKKLIFGFVLMVVILVLAFSFLTPKVYKIDTFLEMGAIGGQLLEKPEQLIAKINNDIYKTQVEEKEFKISVTNPKNTNLIALEIESNRTQEAQNFLAKINNLILKDHQERIKVKKELIENDIERIGNNIAHLEKEKKNLEDKEKALEQLLPYQQLSQQLSGSLFMLLDVREKLAVKKQEIENSYLSINSLKISLEDIQPTKIIKDPTISKKPVKPKILFNVIIAVVLGSFLGVLLAFLKEWWQKYQKPLTRTFESDNL